MKRVFSALCAAALLLGACEGINLPVEPSEPSGPEKPSEPSKPEVIFSVCILICLLIMIYFMVLSFGFLREAKIM